MNRFLRCLSLYSLSLFFLLALPNTLFAQVPVINANEPRHETASQQVISVLFTGAVTGTPTPGDWTVKINGSTITVSGVSYSANRANILFNANSAAGHGGTNPWVLPGETLTVSYTNNSNSLVSGGTNVATFGPLTSKNNYSADCSDVNFISSGLVAAEDRCSPVNTDFFRWTYRLRLLFRNSSKWVTSDNQAAIVWGDPSNTVSYVSGYLSDNSGTFNTNFVTSVFSGSVPEVLMSFRTGTDFTTGIPNSSINPFSYPDNTGICNFGAKIFPYNALYFGCNTGANLQTKRFDSFDYDDQNTGSLSFNRVLPPANLTTTSDLICLGTNVGSKFTDTSIFNCIGDGSNLPVPGQGAVSSPVNSTIVGSGNQERWVRIVYGGVPSPTAQGNIRDIRVNGTPVTNSISGVLLGGFSPNPVLTASNLAITDFSPNPTPLVNGYVTTGIGGLGVPDANGVVRLNVPATATTSGLVSDLITTLSTANHVPGQRFLVTIQYWNLCNPYPTSAPVEYTGLVSGQYLEIITRPNPISFTPNPANFCEGQANGNYQLTQSGGTGGTYKWYSTFPLAVAGDLEKTGGTFNPVTEASIPGVVNKSPGSTTTTNFFITETLANGCESLPTTIPFKIVKNVTGGTITHPGPSPICSGDVPASFASSILPTGGDGAGSYTYQWKVATTSGGPYVNAVGTGSTTAGPYTPTSGIAATSFYVREATSGTKTGSGTCTVALSNEIQITVNTTPTAGTVTANQTICESPGDPANLAQTVAPTGGNGIYAFQWQSATAIAGPYTNIAGATSSSYDPPAGLLVTTFYRRVVTSGICPVNTATTVPITITVHNLVNPGTIGNAQSICSGQVPVGLTGTPATGGDGSTYSYQWEQSTTGVGGPYSNATGVSTSQNYTAPSLTTTTHYRRRATSLTCPSTNSNIIQIIVNPVPTAANPTGGGAVCSGNPAPDIVWVLTGSSPYSGTWTDGITVFPFTAPGVSQTSTELRVSSPNTLLAGTYRILSLTDANGCAATALGNTTTITIGGTAPSIDPGSALSIISACDAGSSTLDPSLNFSLDDAGSSNTGPFTLTYKIDGGSNRTKSFNTGANGNPSPLNAVIFSDSELDNLAPSPHTIALVSLLSPFGCQATLTNSYSFTVNPLPANPTGAVNGFVCSTSPTGALLSVNDPGAGFLIEWYTTAGATTLATGTTSGSNNRSFTPTSNATATYFALSRNTTTACRSASTLAVTNTLDTAPAAASAGAAQPLICASTTTVTLAASAANNGGIGAWTIAGQVAYNQNFSNFINGTSSSTALNGWTRSVSGANVFNGGVGTFDIQTNRFVATNTNGSLGGGAGNIGEVVWNSAIIDISSIGPATATVDLINVTNNLAAPEDYIKAFYKLNGGAEIAFTTNGSLIGNFANSTAQTTGLSGATLQIVIRASVDAAANSVAFDNVVVRSATAGSISFSDPNSPTSTVTGLPAPAPSAAAITTTLTWTVSSALGVCANTTSNVAITINPLPKTIDTTPKLCETLPGGNQTTGVDLTSFNTAVTDAPTVAWFTNPARTIPVGTPTSHTVLGGSPILYFRATFSLTTNCVNDGQLTFTVNSQPAAANQSGPTTQFCEDVIGGNQKAGIDLTTTFNTAITGGAANRSVAWFSDVGLITPVPTPTSYTLVGSQTLYAQVTNTITSCTRTATVSLSIKPRPVNNPISGNASVCTGSNIILYQLDPSLNPGSTYSWTIVGTPAAAVQVFGGGGTNTSNFFALLKFPAATGTVQIDVFETLNGCTGNLSSLTVNVNTAPAANTITGISQVCSNQTGVQYKVTSPNVTSTYTWTVTGATVASAANDKINVDFSTISPVSITVSETSTSGCVGPPANLNVTVNPRPVMTSVNANTVCSGFAPTLNFTASIASTFNWTVTGITGTIGGALVGDTGTGNINQILVNNSGVVGSVTYSVTPTVIAAPNCDGASQSVTITVNPAPVLVNPQTKTICSGSQVNYEIVTSPLNLPSGTTFTWAAPTMSAGAAQGTSGTNIPAGAAGTLHITDILNNTTNASITATYTIAPTSGAGCPGTPRDVVITINPQPSVATTLDNSSCSGANIGLTLATAPGSPTAVNYNITSRSVPGGLTPGGSNAIVPATGVSNNYLSNDNFKNLGTSTLNVTYTIVPVSSFGCLGSPKIITIQILPEPSLSASLDKTVCSGDPTALSLTTAIGSTAAVSYNIVGVTIGVGLVPSGTNAIVPASGVALNYLSSDKFSNTTNANLTVVYQVVPVGAGGCGGDPPKSVTITVQPEPVISSLLNNAICSRSSIGLALNTQGTSVAAASYDIISRTIDAGLVSAGTNASVPASNVPAGYLTSDSFTNTGSSPLTVTYRVTGKSAAGCVGAFRDIIITINPEPVLSATLNRTTCSDINTNLVLNTNGTSVAAFGYNITARSISGGLVANVANAAVPANGVTASYLSNDIFTNTGSSSLTVTYTVAPVSSFGCIGISQIITVTIDPEPVVATNLDGGVCSNVAIALNLNTNGSSVAASTYNITARTIAPGLVANAGNVTVPASGVLANYLANDIYSNTGNSALNVTYTVVPLNGTCLGDPKVITLIVNPEPVMSNSLDAIVCSNALIGLTLNTNGTSVAAANYTITLRSIAVGLVAAGTNAVVPATSVASNYLNADKFTNTSASVLVVTYTVIPVSATGCPGPAKLISISINPEPVVSTTLNGSACSDDPINLTLNTNGSSVAAATYNVTARTIAGGLTPGGTNATVPSSGVASNYLFNDSFTNTGTLPLNVNYTVVPVSAAGCLGVPKVVTFTINPKPVVSTLLNTTACSDGSIGLILNTNGTSVAAASYNITARAITGGMAADGSNGVIPALGVSTGYLTNDKFTNVGSTAQTVSYTVVPVSSAGCLGSAQVIVITINPEPVVSTLLNSSNCSDAAIGLVLNTNGISVGAANYNITARTISLGLVPSGTNMPVPASGVLSNYLSNDKFNNVTNAPLSVLYTVVPVSASGCLGNPQVVTISINPEPVLSPSLNSTICSDLATALVLNTNGTSVAATNYNITSITVAGGLVPAGSNASIPATGVNANYLGNDKFTNTGPIALTVVYRIVPVSASSCLGDPVNVTLTINPEPVVSAALDLTVCSNIVIGLNLNTNGTSISASTYNITARTISGGLVANGSNATVPASGVAAGYLNADKFTNTTAGALGVTYTVVPISGAGCLGNPVNVIVTINPEPVVSPSLNATICSDLATNLNLNTNGTSIGAVSYNVKNRTIAVGLSAASGNATVPANLVSLNYLAADRFTNVGALPLNVTYTVEPVSSLGCLGQQVIITQIINPEPVVSTGLDKTVCSDLAIALTLNTLGTSVAASTYNFTSRSVSGGLVSAGTNVAIPANNVAANYASADVFTNTGTSNLTVTYTVIPVSAAGCLGDPKVITITVNPEPVVATGLNSSTCSGQAISLNLNTNGTSVVAQNYNITARNISGGLTPGGSNSVVPAVGVASGYLASDVFSNTGATSLTVDYTIVPKSASGCLGDSKVITITIDPQPVLSTTLNATICSDLPIGLVLNTNGTSVSAATYDIVSRTIAPGLTSAATNSVVPSNGVAASFLNADKFTNTGNSNLTVIYSVIPISAAGCRGATQSVTITIAPEPVLATSLDKTVCSDIAGGIALNTIATSISASSFNITSVSIQAGLTTISAAAVPANGVASGYLATDTYQNLGSTPLNVSYTVVPVSGAGCLGDPLMVKQIVNPEPVLANLNKSVCSDLGISLSLSTIGTSVSASTYNVTARTIAVGLTPAGANAVVAANGVAASYLFNDKFTNITNGVLNVTYTIVPVSSSNCLGDPVIVTIGILPEPVLSPTLNKTVCSGSASGLILSTTPSSAIASVYNITSIVVAGGLTPAASNVTAANNVSSTYLQNDKFTNVGSSSLTVQYTVVPVTVSGCLGDPLVVVLTINPQPVIDPSLAAKVICSRANTGITLTTNGSSVAAITYDVALVSQDSGLTGTPTTGTALLANAIASDSYINVSSITAKVIYQVTPKSAAGCFGSPFTITVTINPEPVVSPTLNNTVCSDDASNIILATNGISAAAASYELVSLSIPGSVAANVSNVPLNSTGGINLIKNDKYTNTTASSAIVVYGIRGTSNANCLGQTQLINLTINPKPVLDPALNPTPVCSGVISNVTLGVAPGSVAAVTYNINAIAFAGLTAGPGNSGIGSGKPANTIINDVYVNTTNSPLQVVYKIVPVSAAGCLGAEATVTLTINPSPALLTGLDKTVCSEDISGITFGTKSTSVAAANYNIINVVIQAGLTQIAGNVGARSGVGVNEIVNDKFQNSTNGTRIVTYTIEPVSAASCKGPQVDIVLTVEPAITMITPPSSTICSDTPNTPSATNILLNSNTIPSAGAITFDYTAVSSPSGAVTGFFPAQSNLPKLTIIKDNLVNGTNSVATVTYTITPKAVGAKGGSGCQGFIATTVVITVEPKPRLSITPATQIVCEGVATTMTLSSSTVPSAGTIQFTKISAVPSGGMTLTSAPRTNYINGEQIGDVWDNPTLTAQTVTYTFRSQIVGGSGCISEDIIAVLTVNPAPTITASAQPAICSSDFVNITLTPDVANTIATYTKSAPAVISGASNGAGNLIFQTLFYNSLTPTVANSDGAVTVNYTVTPKANGCTGPSIVVPVIVNPKPKILNVASTQKICHGNTLTIPLTSNVIGANYTWTVDNPSGLPGIADQTVPVSTGVNQAITNTTGVQASLTYTIKAFGPGVNPNDCEGDQKIVIVTVAPQMSASFQNLPSSICKGTSEFLIIQLDGQAPFSFVYNQNDGTTSTDITVNGAGNFKVIQVKPTATTTYTIKSITDAFNCPFTVTGQSVTITVGDTDPIFSVVGATKACSPHQFLFQYNQKAGTQYTWQWQDGSADSTYLATTNVTNKTVPHTFTNVNPNKDQDYNVTMRVELPAPFPGCFKFSSKKVTINSIIVTNVIPDKTDICSGETIRFSNQSLGVTSHRWFWRNTGTAQVNEIRATSTVNYVLVNTGTLNPQPMQVVYQANNGNCPAPDVVVDIKVYKGATANFNEGTVPPFNSGSSTVTITNTSTPFDITQFRYDWIFGLVGDANPATLVQSTLTPIPVVYSSPGTKQISLSVTNTVAEAFGLSCKADFSKNITIILPPLAASFDIDPKEFCFPGSIKLKNVVGTGFVHEWRVLDKKTGASFTSNVADPVEFKITSPGEYTVSYKTSIPSTGQSANAPLVDVKIYDVPLASFDLRPDLVFVPDQEMLTFNFTSGATNYRWNFGDTKDESDKFEPSYKYPVEGKYDVTLIAENDHGGGVVCRDTLIRKIIAKQGGQAKIPNAFTPNTSGPSSNGQGGGGTFNDVFLPIVRGVPSDSDAYNLQIYDRWGNLIFESRSSTHGWDGYNKDGKIMPSGVYVYKLTVRFSDSQRTTQVGDVTMIY